MGKKVFLLNIIILISLFLNTGCSKEKTEQTEIEKETEKNTEMEYIVVTEATTEAIKLDDEDYFEINSVEGYSFCVRKSDYEKAKGNYNSLFYIYDTYENIESIIGKTHYGVEYFEDIEQGIKRGENFFSLYIPNECLYYVFSGGELGKSLYYYDDNELRIHEIHNILAGFCDDSFTINAENVYTVDTSTGDMRYEADVKLITEEDPSCKWEGTLYIWETNYGQSFMLVCGLNFPKEQRDYVVNSLKPNDSYQSGILEYQESEITLDYGGISLNGTFNDMLGLTSDMYSDFRYSDVSNYDGNKSPFFINPYYPYLVKYDVYNLKYPVSPDEFIESGMYSDSSIFKERGIRFEGDNIIRYEKDKTYTITDADGVDWKVYSSRCFNGGNLIYGKYKYVSLYVRINGNECIVFETWCGEENKDIFDKAMEKGIKSSHITPGESAVVMPLTQMTEAYETYMQINPEESISTDTETTEDISLELSDPSILEEGGVDE